MKELYPKLSLYTKTSEVTRSLSRTAGDGDPRAAQTLKAVLGLRQLILDGELRAGQRVPELWLVKRTGVSRTPIRAALLRLAGEGLLERSASRGFMVRSFNETDVFDAIDVRGTLEGAAARRAAERGPSRAELNELRDCVGAIDSVLKGHPLTMDLFSDYLRLNERFHALLVELAHSPTLSGAVERIIALPFASPSAFVLQESLAELKIAQHQHRAILDAIAAGEGARAESVAREHSNMAKITLQSAGKFPEYFQKVAGGSLIRVHGQSD